jgi:phenylalanyl-tRNA synthetase beta chain
LCLSPQAARQIGGGKKSLAFEILIQPKDRTLGDKEIESLCDKIVLEVGRVSGGILR